MLPDKPRKSRHFRTALLALALAFPCVSNALPSASVDGYMGSTTQYYDPGQSSNSTMVSISNSWQGGLLSYSASAGGGSLTGGPDPFIRIATSAYNAGNAYINDTWANAGTWSNFYVGAKPGFQQDPSVTSVPIILAYSSTLVQSFAGRSGYSRNDPEPYNMAFYFDDVNWRAYNTTGTLGGTIALNSTHSTGIYTSFGSRAQESGSGSFASASASLDASIRPYVDPTWNASHGNGYQIYYLDSAGNTLAPVPEPETYGMLMAGVSLLGFLFRRRAERGADV